MAWPQLRVQASSTLQEGGHNREVITGQQMTAFIGSLPQLRVHADSTSKEGEHTGSTHRTAESQGYRFCALGRSFVCKQQSQASRLEGTQQQLGVPTTINIAGENGQQGASGNRAINMHSCFRFCLLWF